MATIAHRRTRGAADSAARRTETLKLASLLEIGQALADTRNLRAALGRVLDALGHHQEMLRSFIMLLDSETEKLRTEASYGVHLEAARSDSFRICDGIVWPVKHSDNAFVDCLDRQESL